MTDNSYKILLRLVGIIIFIIILRKVNLQLITTSLSSINYTFILCAILITPVFFIIKIYRWKYLLHKIGINYSLIGSITTYGAGLFAGQITPGQTGELVRGVFLARRGYDYSLAIQTVIIDRIFDLTLLISLAIPGIIRYTDLSIKFLLFYLTVFIFVIFFCAYIIRLFFNVDSVKPKSFIFNIYSKSVGSLKQILSNIKKFKTISVLISFTVLALILNLIRFYFILLSLDINLPIYDFIAGIIFATVAGLLPISFAGLGIREAALIVVFNSAGLNNEDAISFSILIFIIGYLFNLVWGFPAWLVETK